MSRKFGQWIGRMLHHHHSFDCRFADSTREEGMKGKIKLVNVYI